MMPQPKNSALAVAVRLLAQRDHSERELSDKLAQRSYPGSEIDEALSRLRERGYVDDTVYCAKLADNLWHSGKWGLAGVTNQLRRRGLSEAVIRKALTDFDLSQELEYALALLEKRGFSWNARDKACRFLASRGFASATIAQSMDLLRNNE